MNNAYRIACKLESLIDEVKEIVESHESIIASDDQYDDPELWWSRPLLEKLQEAQDELE